MIEPTPDELNKLQQVMRLWESGDGMIPDDLIVICEDFATSIRLMDIMVAAFSEYIVKRREVK